MIKKQETLGIKYKNWIGTLQPNINFTQYYSKTVIVTTFALSGTDLKK